ncbi:D-alanyl-D-alanine carboxypeptidase family protein [Acetobacter aceti]|uniref:serine-type D-Ala-D-Ala carboxypeptidase n=1 Tax=Acetobacter aceti TaxID=435 RepID=A0A6S6PKK9_ACEAC|nr:D-alanyl-D-alanine carboxypeptidase family protein [Acetobacter aceti]BCI67191.1 D-alanyl-D-alanine carboxypeptidase [Acetobacter aceti]
MQTRRILLASGAAAITGGAGLLNGVGLSGTALAAKPRHAPRHGGKAADSAQTPAPAVDSTPAMTPIGPVDTVARWACITDFDSGQVLLEKAADEHMPPSSLTKMMTAYIVFGMLNAGRLKLDQTLPVSEKAWRMQGSKMFVPLGESVPVQDLIQGMLIQSGNDACIVLAEGVSGSEEQFVALMNDTAAKLGMANSHFMNTTGWPAEGHYMSARDVCTIATHLIRDFPQYYHFFSETSFAFNKINQGNRNVLVDKGLADGLKTGHTDAGGFGLCASSKREGRRVVMGINGMASSNIRAHEGERLLGWAFANFELAVIAHKGQVLDQAPVWIGQDATVPVVASRDVTFLLPHGWQSRVHISVDYLAPVSAPITVGQSLGQLTITLPTSQTALVPPAPVAGAPMPAAAPAPQGTVITVPVEAGSAVAKLGFGGRIAARLGMKRH